MTSPLGPSESVTVPIAAPTPSAEIWLMVTTSCSARAPSAAASKIKPTEKRDADMKPPRECLPLVAADPRPNGWEILGRSRRRATASACGRSQTMKFHRGLQESQRGGWPYTMKTQPRILEFHTL